MLYLKKFFIVFLLIFCINAKISSVPEQEFTNILNKAKKYDYLSVDYIHSIYSPLRSKKRIIEGKAFFAKPAKFRWIKLKPIKEEIIYDGQNLYIYNVEDKTINKFASITKQAKDIEDLTSMFLDADKFLSKYVITKITHENNEQLISVDLKPKDKKIDIESIHFIYSLEQNFINSLKLNYTDGKVWEFKFQNHDTQKLQDEVFSIKNLSDIKIINVNEN